MSRLEIFMLYELMNKASMLVEVPQLWFEEMIMECEDLTPEDREFFLTGEGTSIGRKLK